MIFSWHREYSFQRNTGMQAGETEEVKQQMRVDVLMRVVRKDAGHGQIGWAKTVGGLVKTTCG